jgi:hypothetical protein
MAARAPEQNAPRPGKSAAEKEHDVVAQAGEESFPASDPPSWTPLHTGRRDKAEPPKMDGKRKD